MNWYKISQKNITKKDIQAIRYILRLWISGGWDDRKILKRLLEKHNDILEKFKPSSPIRIWRNERIQSDVGYAHNSGWENQYQYPTAWSMIKTEAEGYAKGHGRRLITVIAPPEDIICSISTVEHYVQKMGLKPIDIYNQSEIIVKPNPSFLNEIRPPIIQSEIPNLRKKLEELVFLSYLSKKQNDSKLSDSEAKSRINWSVENLSEEELPEKIKEYQNSIL